MKNQSLLLAALIAAASATAGPISPEQALARTEGTGLVPKSRAATPRLVYTEMSPKTSEAALYVFDRGMADNGYMILPADDEITPVLGYADSGSFDADNMPDNMRWWLSEYANQIAFAAENKTSGQPEIFVKSTAAKRADIAPMCKTKWNQDAPYNNDCPKAGTIPTYTGCVATAMAQAMKYFNYPEKGKGTKQYTWNYTLNGANKSLAVRFTYSSTTFDWANMLDTYTTGSYNTTQASAVSTLMKAAGVGVEMKYGTNASGAHSQDIPYALVTYLNYDAATCYYPRDYYSISEWEQMIYDNLVNCGPVIYGGQSQEGGHSFICDGYMNGYFHFNWGWGGMSDGFFLLTALDPGSQGIGGTSSAYNYGQDAILGMQKPQAGSKTNYLIAVYEDNTATIRGNSIDFGMVFNAGSLGYPFTGCIGVKVVNTATSEVKYIRCGTTLSAFDPWDKELNGWSVTMPSDLAEGTYKVSQVYAATLNPSDSDWKDMLVEEGQPRVFTVTKSSTGLSLQKTDAKYFSVTDIKFDTEIYDKMPFTITYTITNPNDYPRSAEVSPNFMSTNALLGSQIVGYGSSYVVSLDANETKTLTQTFTLVSNGLNAGTYTFFMGEDVVNEDNTVSTAEISQKQQVEVKKANTGASLQLTSFSIDNSSSVNAASITGSYTLKGVGGYSAGVLTLKIFNSAGTQSLATFSLPAFFVDANETKTFNFDVIFPEGTPGTSYMTALYFNNQQVSNATRFTVNGFVGIDDINSDDTVVSREYYTLQGVRVAEDNLRSGIYIERTVTAAGKTTSRKVVK